MPLTQTPLPPLTVDDLDGAAALLSGLFDLLPGVGCVVVDAELRVRSIGGDAVRRRTAVGHPVSAFAADGPDAALPPELWVRALAGETTTLDSAEVEAGASIWIRFLPLRDQSGAIIGAAAVSQNVSGQRAQQRELRRRTQQQAALQTLSSKAMHGMPVPELTQDAVRIVEESLGADLAAVMPYAAGGGLGVRAVSRSSAASPVAVPVQPPPGPADPSLVMEHMRRAAAAVLVPDLRVGPLRAPTLEAQGIVSLIVAPIGPTTARWGVLGAGGRTANAFCADDAAFVQSVANVLAAAGDLEQAARRAASREAQLNAAQSLSNTGSWELDLDTGTTQVSDHLRVMFGLQGACQCIDDVFASAHPDDRPRVRAHVAAATGRGRAEPVEFRVVAADGEVRLFRGHSLVAVDEGARTLQGTVQDVTDARRAEETVRRSEERFRRGFDSAPIGMTLVEPETGRYLRVNAAYCTIVGRTEAELLGLTYDAVVHPDDVNQPRRAEYAAGETSSLVTEGRYMRPDGTVRWASISSSSVMDPDGGVDVLYSQVLDITDRHEREEELRRELEQAAGIARILAALAEDRFELHAQPIVDLATGAVVQHELLIRMRSPEGELIPPGDFLPLAERHGIIRDIDRWVVARGVELAATGMGVEINLSGTSMGDATLIDDIDQALARTGADPSKLVFEITETAVIEHVDTARTLANRLRERGCRFALDDFGTGFAGMSSLKTLPLDYLKIDREFVKDLCTSPADRAVMVATVELAHAFKLQTIAEGVEDAATLELLAELGVDHAQGFFLGRPQPLDAGR